MKTEISAKVDFSKIRYSQCWEDAEILLEALDIKEDEVCLSIASAGDNSFALLSKNPKKVIAIDISPAQIAVCELKKAAFSEFDYEEMAGLLGIVKSEKRIESYKKIKEFLSIESQKYFDKNMELIKNGIIHAGKFERFFSIFRKFILPLVHSKVAVKELIYKEKSYYDRLIFFNKRWNNKRWKMLFKLFFSKTIVGALARDPRFFDYADIPLTESVFSRCTHALTTLDPSNNSYVEYILTGEYKKNLPFYLRKENYSVIKKNIGKVEFVKASLEEFLEENKKYKIDKYNMSNIFEYMSREKFLETVNKVIGMGKEAKMVYWNLVVKREYPSEYQSVEKPHIVKDKEKNRMMHRQDKAFFYSKFIVEEIKNGRVS